MSLSDSIRRWLPKGGRREYRRKFGGGDWQTRNRGLFELNVDYRGKSILDAGCNLGIVGYEISKQGPSFYHGLDIYPPALSVARAIFSGVPVEHRFDRVDLGNEKQIAAVLKPAYDIVIFLAVFGHIANKYGETAAASTLRALAARCRQSFVATGTGRWEKAVVEALQDSGFRVVDKRIQSERTNFYHFKRADGAGPA
jgi:ribosomal protein L11 methylase PrmA